MMMPVYRIVLASGGGPAITISDNMDGTAMIDPEALHEDVEPWDHEEIREMGLDLLAVAAAVKANSQSADKGPDQGGEV